MTGINKIKMIYINRYPFHRAPVKVQGKTNNLTIILQDDNKHFENTTIHKNARV
jgi:hypothetical protein